MKKTKKNVLCGGISFLLIVIILFCTSQTVMSQEKADKISRKKYYAAMEKQYLTDVKQILEEKGYADSGVTVRWVTDEEGMRNYTVMIHHWKLSGLSVSEANQLQEDLAKMEFEDLTCHFAYEFMQS